MLSKHIAGLVRLKISLAFLSLVLLSNATFTVAQTARRNLDTASVRHTASRSEQADQVKVIRFGLSNIYDPIENIRGGITYFKWLMKTFDNNVSLALAGYNAGEGAVIKYGYAVPPYKETQDYVKKITAKYAVYSYQMNGKIKWKLK